MLVPLALAACGQSIILQKPTERLVSRFVFQHTGVQPRDVTCPSREPAKVGQAFQCHFTGPDGKYTAYLLVTGVKGGRVDYRIQTERDGQTIDATRAEQIVADFVLRHTHSRPHDVRCPSGVAPLVGHTLECRFTGPGGEYTASLLIVGVNGGNLEYRIRTARAG